MRTNRNQGPSGRPTRTPVGQRQILNVRGKDPNFVYRIVNDVGDRLGQFIEGGWELVTAESVKIGDKRVDIATAQGTNASVTVDKTGQKAFVMRIPKEYYDEDQEAKQVQLRRLEESMRSEASQNGYTGSISTSTNLVKD